MKLVLYFCILILGHTAFAGSSGGFDDDGESTPAKPAASKPATVKPATTPVTSPAPAKVVPSAKTNFPQCPRSTGNAELAQDMMEKVLGIDESFPMVVYEDKPCKGNGCTTIKVTKVAGKLNISLSSPSIDGPSQICQDGDDLKISANYMMQTYWLKLEKRNGRKFRLVMPSGYEEYSNTYSVGAK